MDNHKGFKVGDLVIVKHLANTPHRYGIVMEIQPDFIISKRTLYWVELILEPFRSPHHACELTPTNGDNKDENRFYNELISIQNNSGDNKEKDGKKGGKTYRESREWEHWGDK